MSGCSVKKEVTGVPQCSDTPVVFLQGLERGCVVGYLGIGYLIVA